MTDGRVRLSKAENVLVDAIESGLPQSVKAREIIANFHQVIRTKSVSGIMAWMKQASDCLMASFCSGDGRGKIDLLQARLD